MYREVSDDDDGSMEYEEEELEFEGEGRNLCIAEDVHLCSM